MSQLNDSELAALVERDEQGFFERFRSLMSQLMNEGIDFKLPS